MSNTASREEDNTTDNDTVVYNCAHKNTLTSLADFEGRSSR